MKGKLNRLARILNPKDGRGLIIAVDHGMALGPMTGLEDPGRIFERLDDYADAWLMTKGVFTHAFSSTKINYGNNRFPQVVFWAKILRV